jgi:hypothetical protein
MASTRAGEINERRWDRGIALHVVTHGFGSRGFSPRRQRIVSLARGQRELRARREHFQLLDGSRVHPDTCEYALVCSRSVYCIGGGFQGERPEPWQSSRAASHGNVVTACPSHATPSIREPVQGTVYLFQHKGWKSGNGSSARAGSSNAHH